MSLLSMLSRSRKTGYTTTMLQHAPINSIILTHTREWAYQLALRAKEIDRKDLTFVPTDDILQFKSRLTDHQCIIPDNAAFLQIVADLERSELANRGLLTKIEVLEKEHREEVKELVDEIKELNRAIEDQRYNMMEDYD